jgi:hypothetical protein
LLECIAQRLDAGRDFLHVTLLKAALRLGGETHERHPLRRVMVDEVDHLAHEGG